MLRSIFRCALIWVLRNILRGIRNIASDPSPRGTLARAVRGLLEVLGVVALAAAAGAHGNTALSSGITTGYSAQAKAGYARSLGFSLFAFAVLVVVIFPAVLMEGPLKIAVSPTDVTLLYRFPWRNTTISMKSISNVDLQRHYYRGSMGHRGSWLGLVITHNGIATKVSAKEGDWYDQQMTEAYRVIQSRLPWERRSPSATQSAIVRHLHDSANKVFE